MALCVFGLTGGIASGKSVVGAQFRSRGLPVVDADELARCVVEPGSAGLAEIVRVFGAGMLDAEQRLDRRQLGAVVFADRALRERLNAILHPRVRALARERLAAIARTDEPLACYEVPLLFEVGLERELRPVVVVDAPEEQRVARIMARDQLSESAARARIAAQMPLKDKVLRADYVIDNHGSVEQAREQADDVIDRIARSFGVDLGRYPQRSQAL